MRLPDTRPEHIIAARTLKRFLTGSLNTQVSTYPPFPWTEAVYLRAQIARIAAATLLAPAGWLSSEEDEESGKSVLAAAEEIEPLALPDGEPEEWLANWVHRCGPLLAASAAKTVHCTSCCALALLLTLLLCLAAHVRGPAVTAT